MNGKFDYLWTVRDIHDQMVQLNVDGWLKNEFLTWQWWLLLAFLIFPWILWSKLVERDRIMEIVLFGTMVMIPTLILDNIGNDIRFWSYPTELIPFSPNEIAFDLAMVPVAFMLLYQYFTTWKSFSVGLVLMASFYAFVGEPLAHLLEMVIYIEWKYTYSFVYYIILGLGVRFVVEKIRKIRFRTH